MANTNSDAHLLVSRDRSPLQDVTNSSLHTSTESSSAARNKSSQSWYARLSDEKKAKLLEKRRVARQQKKAAAVGTDNHAQEAQPHASSISSEQCIPLSDITNTQIDVAICTAASSAGTVQLQRDNIVGRKRSGQSWYAGLSDERRAEYINKQKMARLARKAATGGVNVQVPTPSAPQASSAHTSAPANYGVREHQLREIVGQCSTSAPANYGGREHQLQEIVGQCSKHDLEEEGSDDWLHTNPTYVRQLRSAKHVHDVLELSGSHEEDSSVPTSFISGRSIEPLDAYHEKDRLRKKKKYSEMRFQHKEALLSRNRAYKMGRPNPPCENNRAGGHNNEEDSDAANENNEDDSDAHGIFEPVGQIAESEDCVYTLQEGETSYDDDELRIFIAQGNEFESYTVTVDGSHSFETNDPYDYVYKNLPTKHHVLKPVKDCVHCGAMRFQYEGPAFCCRKAIGVLSLVGST